MDYTAERTLWKIEDEVIERFGSEVWTTILHENTYNHPGEQRNCSPTKETTMSTWLEQEKTEARLLRIANQSRAIILVSVQYYPARENNHPYRLETIDAHAKRPRQRWYATYAAVLDAVERANPGTVAREA